MTLLWIFGLILLLAAFFAIWWLVQSTKKPRKFFRGGHADPEQEEFPETVPGPLAPETVQEPVEGSGLFSTTIGEEAAAVIEGERHGAPEVSTDIDAAARGVVNSAAGPPVAETAGEAEAAQAERSAPEPATVFPGDDGERLRAADEHAKAAEQHAKAAEALEADPVSPGDESETGETYPLERRSGDSHGHRA